MIKGKRTERVAIVGAGPGGLTCAMILARRGFQVTVYEAQPVVGGRNAALHLGPYSFDIGPTFLMLRGVLEEVFHEAGASANHMLELRDLELMYRLRYGDDHLDVSSDRERMRAEIARCFPGRADRYEVFFRREQSRFRALFPCLQKSYHTARSLFSPDLLKALPHLALGRSLFDVMQGVFGEERLALAFTFQSKYLGMSPWECPGMFAIIPYIEHAFGIQHPVGGLSRISEAMAEVARGHGATIRLGTVVEEILVRNGRAEGLRLAGGEEVEADEVVINADFGYAATRLFRPGVLRKYTPARLARMRLSCSTFMIYLGVDRIYDLPHHTVVFARDYRRNVEAVFGKGVLTADLSFYVRNAVATDPGLAPPGHAAVYILAPVPNRRSGIDWRLHASELRERVLEAVEARAPMPDLRRHIVAERLITPADWESEFRVFEGATFNLAHNLGQMIYWRPRNRFEEVAHCYLVGGGTHPGSGLPTIYESGRISANLICRARRVPFVSGNLEV